MSGKVYAVKHGRQTGLYYSWKECQEQVKGFKGAKFKGFRTEEEANFYLQQEEPDKEQLSKSLGLEQELKITKDLSSLDDHLVIYTDGSNTKGGRYSGSFVVVKDFEVVTEFCEEGFNPEAGNLRNVAGELMAAMKAALYAVNETDKKQLIIFHDYEGVSCWVTDEWKCKNKITKGYRDFMKRIMQKIDIYFIYVKGHQGNPFNERADYLAKYALGLTKEQKELAKLEEE